MSLKNSIIGRTGRKVNKLKEKSTDTLWIKQMRKKIPLYFFQITSVSRTCETTMRDLILVPLDNEGKWKIPEECIIPVWIMTSITMINKHHDQKQFIGQRVYFTSQITIHQWGKSQQEPGGRNWSTGHRGVSLPGFVLTACSVCFQDYQPKRHHREWAGPSHTKRQSRNWHHSSP